MGRYASFLMMVLVLAGTRQVFAQAAPSEREQEIRTVEQQIQDLQKKLQELRQPAAKPAPSAPVGLPADWVKALNWRSIGPANMGGRITALAVHEADPTTYWVATASGGLLKTTNNGRTFEHQFDREATVSIGDVCVAPSNKDIVWVGTGENNPRNSVSFGDGVYKSIDGGKTWKNMGLRQTFQIGKILIHPTDPNTVYVGALGRLYGPNPERGLYKTTNGGDTWERILFVDDRTGVIDMRMHPTDPESLVIATWERLRDGFDSWPGGGAAEGYDGYDPIKKWGPGSGIYKTTDGGRTFRKLTQGLPSCAMGRIGLDWYQKDPKTLFAVIDTEQIGMGEYTKDIRFAPYLGVAGEDMANNQGVRVLDPVEQGPAALAGLKRDDVIKQLGEKKIRNQADLLAGVLALKTNTKTKILFQREDKPAEAEVTIGQRPLGPPYAGIVGEDAPEAKGARLTQVVPNEPAFKAGLREQDIVTSFAEKPIKNYQDLLTVLRERKAGSTVKVTVIRDNMSKTMDLNLEERPGYGEPGPYRSGVATPKRPFRTILGGQRENMQDEQGPHGQQYGGVYQSNDGGESWTRINSVNARPMYFSQVRVDPSDSKYLYVAGVVLYRSSDGGKTFKGDASRGVHADHHALWINPKDGRHLIVGSDGGFYVSHDRADTWDHLNHLALGQFYHVAVCNKKPYWVYGGLQDNGSWGAPSMSFSGGILNEDWINIGGGDGYVCRVDAHDPEQIYFESQDGIMGRYHLRTGQRAGIRPREPKGAPPYRFNWNTPYILSHHNSRVYYCGGNYVFRSYDRGNDLRPISPELTRTKRGSATALAESPGDPEVLWVGTDDGAMWVTRDGGKNWSNITAKVGLPAPRWVSTIEASRHAPGRAYVVFDGHRSNDDDPYVYVTEDFGQTWKSLRANLPKETTRCLREDISNPNLLYLGTEFAIYASISRGESWTKLNNNLPTVAIHEIAVHPTAGEIVAATHGRSLWILDVSALRQIGAASLGEKPTFYQPAPVIRWRYGPNRGGTNRRFVGANPPGGARLYYSLPKPAQSASMTAFDILGNPIASWNVPTTKGLHETNWNLQPTAALVPRSRVESKTRSQAESKAHAKVDSKPSAKAARQTRGQPVTTGAVRVVLQVDGVDYPQVLRVEADPRDP